MPREIPLTKGYVAIVDDADYAKVAAHKWRAQVSSSTVYAFRNLPRSQGRKWVSLHTFIMNPPNGLEIDHRDWNGLNCQRSNLRVANRGQNMCNRRRPINNSSGYKGVSWSKKGQKWQAHIQFKRQQFHLGLFVEAVTAAQTYDAKARELFGEFAVLNFPEKA